MMLHCLPFAKQSQRLISIHVVGISFQINVIETDYRLVLSKPCIRSLLLSESSFKRLLSKIIFRSNKKIRKESIDSSSRRD